MWRRKAVKAVLFDIGGVVIHARLNMGFEVASLVFGCSERDIAIHGKELLFQLERGEIDSYGLWEELGDILQAEGLGRKQLPENFTSFWSRLLKDSLQVDTDVLEVCERLAERMPVGALSNTIQDHATHLERMGIYDNFNPCVLSCEIGMRKPDLGIYLKAAELMNTDPKHCLFIDDLEENIKGAKAAKMQTHLFTDSESLKKNLSRLGLL